MKKILTLILLCTFALGSYGQADCENFPTISGSYILPKTIALGVDYFTEIGLTGGIGVAYTHPKTYTVKQGVNTFDSTGNSLDIISSIGYRVYRKEYVVSVFANTGFYFGDKLGAQFFVSSKALFPINNKAISIEPLYVFHRGASLKLSFHFII